MFDLLVDFYLDMFEKNPLDAHRNDDGFVQFTDTGDALIDKWEQQIADGVDVDLTEAFGPGSLEYIKKLRARADGDNPYAGMTMKDVAEKMDREARREGLTSDSRRKEIEERLKQATFRRGG